MSKERIHNGENSHIVLIQAGVHDTEFGVRVLANVTPEEDRLARLDHLDNGSLQVGDLGVDVYILLSTVRAWVRNSLQSTGRPPHKFPSLSTV